MPISKNPPIPTLFAFYLGGKHPKSNLELHNLQFAFGHKIEDCFEQLKLDWFGSLKGLHIDSYAQLDFVDGYKISPVKTKNTQDLKLYCIHLGASLEGVFEEQHTTQFTVAKSDKEALLKIYKNIEQPNWKNVHRDLLFEIENVIDLNDQFGLEITKDQQKRSYQITNLYKKI